MKNKSEGPSGEMRPPTSKARVITRVKVNGAVGRAGSGGGGGTRSDAGHTCRLNGPVFSGRMELPFTEMGGPREEQGVGEIVVLF